MCEHSYEVSLNEIKKFVKENPDLNNLENDNRIHEIHLKERFVVYYLKEHEDKNRKIKEMDYRMKLIRTVVNDAKSLRKYNPTEDQIRQSHLLT